MFNKNDEFFKNMSKKEEEEMIEQLRVIVQPKIDKFREDSKAMKGVLKLSKRLTLVSGGMIVADMAAKQSPLYKINPVTRAVTETFYGLGGLTAGVLADQYILTDKMVDDSVDNIAIKFFSKREERKLVKKLKKERQQEKTKH